MLKAGLEELLPHECDLSVPGHPTEYFFSLIFKVLILDTVGGKKSCKNLNLITNHLDAI